MKKLLLSVAVLMISVVTANAQLGTTFSIGLEGSVPMGTFNKAGYNFGIGGSAQVDHKIATDAALTLNIGYLTYSNPDATPKITFSTIPLLGGVKYWFSPKVYGSAQLGAAFNNTKQSGNKLFSSTGFAYSPGIGFNITKGLDLLVKYMGNSAGGGTLSSVGARLAYNFGK